MGIFSEINNLTIAIAIAAHLYLSIYIFSVWDMQPWQSKNAISTICAWASIVGVIYFWLEVLA